MDNKTVILNYIEQVGLKTKMEERKIKIEDIMDYVYEEARKVKDGNCAMVEDKVVFGWVVHYIEDEYKIDQAKKAESKAEVEKNKKAKKEFDKRMKAEEKKHKESKPIEGGLGVPATEEEAATEEPKPEEEHFKQLSLFDSIQEDIKKEEPSEQKDETK